jgi:hypothetical protein
MPDFMGIRHNASFMPMRDAEAMHRRASAGYTAPAELRRHDSHTAQPYNLHSRSSLCGENEAKCSIALGWIGSALSRHPLFRHETFCTDFSRGSRKSKPRCAFDNGSVKSAK